MANKNRDKSNTVKLLTALQEKPYKFGFYAALRQLECRYQNQARLGQTVRPRDDIIRLGQTPTTIFAPATLAECHISEKDLLHLNVYFFGLFGSHGALPLHLTEYARNRSRNAKDDAMIHFMDIFHHRLLSLFYRAWANKEPTVQYDRPESDRFHNYIGSLLGIGIPELQNRDAMPDNSKLHFAAHLASTPHHAEGLSSILKAFFKVPVRIEEFIGEWLKIPSESQLCLGVNLEGGQLGQNTTLGQYSWQRQFKFRLLVGAMDLAEYEKLLPDKSKLKLISSIIKNYLGDEMNWDIRLILKKKQRPATILGNYGQLGLSSWISNQEASLDADDLLISAENLR
jgi:type VI secretion system protein ImpH